MSVSAGAATNTAAGLSAVDIAALLIVLAAVLAWLNRRFLRRPQSIGPTGIALITSLILVTKDASRRAVRPLSDQVQNLPFGIIADI